MKVFKKLASVMLALTLCLGLFGLVACNKNNNATDYSFRVVSAQDEPVAGAQIQLCSDTCLTVVTDENGEAHFDREELAWEIHVYVNGEVVEFDGPTHTPTSYNSEIIVLKLLA